MRLRAPRIRRNTQRTFLAVLLLALMALLQSSRELSMLESVLARGELRMVTRPGPITYYEDARGPNGFEYVLATQFAASLGVKLKVTTTDTLATIYNMLGGPNADFAAATLTITPYRQRFCQFSVPYTTAVQTLIYRRGETAPESIGDLNGQLTVIANSSHEERLNELKASHPTLQWESIADIEMIELMEMVDSGDVAFAVLDSTTYNAHKSLYPNVKSAFALSEPQPLAWAFPGHADDSLVKAANLFFRELQHSGELEKLRHQFFTGIRDFSIASSKAFKTLMSERLPTFLPLFQQVGEEAGIDWHLLAAIAYQESHWNPRAVSPTGVKGLMMLTRRAAIEVNVTDRTDAEESLRGGADYFLMTKDRIPERIKEPDRTWFALAAYNVGLGHLEDARVLTQRAGKDPDSWQAVREHLPLLQRRQYYKTVRHGYARGKEPVLYVKNVRKYMQILQWNTIEQNRRNTREPEPTPPAVNEEWDGRSFLTL